MKKQTGITLIALVITIIVLLILAGVSINAVVGNNGVLNKAQNAVKNTAKAELEEIIGMYDMSQFMGEKKDFKEYLIESSMVTTEEISSNDLIKLNGVDTHLGISTQKGLEIISEEVANGNDYTGVTFYLLNDIEFNNEIDFSTGTLISGTEFNPIGNSNSRIENEAQEGSVKTEFNGVFDGRNYEIRKAYIRDTEETDFCAGLFGYVGKNGIVRNLTMSESYITGIYETGAIVARNRGTISNCINKCDIVSIKLTGGIAGRNTGTIENCINYGNLVTSSTQTGGIVANCDFGENVIVTNCKNYGNITSTSSQMGGIVGGAYNGKTEELAYVTISNCENYGNIGGEESNYINIGGIVGFSRVNIINCINNGEIKGYSDVGGVVGRTAYLGVPSKIENCKNKGVVTGKVARIGGICGFNSGGTISKCSNHETVQLIGEEAFYGVAGIAGGSGSTTNNTRIEYCYNTGRITLNLALENSTQCAGIAGNVGMAEDGSTICEIESCYNMGVVECVGTASTALPAGIGGWGRSIIVKNCYNIGELIKVTTAPRGIWGTYQASAEHTFENNYWLDSCGAICGVATDNSNTGAQPKTDAEMKALAATLGNDYAQDININNGYPYLKVNKP